MGDQYYYADSEKNPQGPYDKLQLEAMVDEGKIGQETLVIKEGGNDWMPLGKLLNDRSERVSGRKIPTTNPVSSLPGFQKIFFMGSVIRFISEGLLFSRVFAIVIRVQAVILAMAAIVGWFKVWRMIIDMSEFGGSGIVIGGIIFQILFFVGIYMVTHVQWIRASHITSLPSSDFIVIPIFSLCLRMIGEIYACITFIFGVGGCILILFSGREAGQLISFFASELPGVGDLVGNGDGTFFAAMIFLISSATFAFFVLVVFYLFAEAILVLVDIARNIRAIRNSYDQQVKAESNRTGSE